MCVDRNYACITKGRELFKVAHCPAMRRYISPAYSLSQRFMKLMCVRQNSCITYTSRIKKVDTFENT